MVGGTSRRGELPGPHCRQVKLPLGKPWQEQGEPACLGPHRASPGSGTGTSATQCPGQPGAEESGSGPGETPKRPWGLRDMAGALAGPRWGQPGRPGMRCSPAGLWCVPLARSRISRRFTSLVAPLTSKQSKAHMSSLSTGRGHGVLVASSAAPRLPRLPGGLLTHICLPLLKEGFFDKQSIPNGTLIVICQRQWVPQGRILWPDPARACRMDFFNVLVNKLPFSQAVEE